MTYVSSATTSGEKDAMFLPFPFPLHAGVRHVENLPRQNTYDQLPSHCSISYIWAHGRPGIAKGRQGAVFPVPAEPNRGLIAMVMGRTLAWMTGTNMSVVKERGFARIASMEQSVGKKPMMGKPHSTVRGNHSQFSMQAGDMTMSKPATRDAAVQKPGQKINNNDGIKHARTSPRRNPMTVRLAQQPP